MIAAYATRDDNKYSVFVISRKMPFRPARIDEARWAASDHNTGPYAVPTSEYFIYEADEYDGFTPVTLNLPFDEVHRINVRRLTGYYRDTNIQALNVHVEEFEISTDFFDNGRFVLNQDTGAFVNGVGPANIFQFDFYIDFDGLPEQPEIQVDRIGGNDVVTWNVDLDARMYFILAADNPNGPFIRQDVTIDDVSSVTLPHGGADRYYRVRIFKYGGYRDSVIMRYDGTPVSDLEDNYVDRIPEHDPPPLPPTLLVWDDFRFPDGTEPEDRTYVERRQSWNVILSRLGFTGGPVHGWGDDGWHTNSTSHAFIHNSNQNTDRVPMRYGNLLTSGIYMTVNGTYQEFRRNLQRNVVSGQQPALNYYIANEGWNHHANVGAINNSTLWFSALMRNPDPSNRGGYIVFSHGHGGGRGGRTASQLAVGLFRDQMFDMDTPSYEPLERIADNNFWGARYTTAPTANHQINSSFVNRADGQNECMGYSNTLLTELQAEANDTVLVVARFHFRNGQDTATIWFNPDKDSLGGDEPTGGHRIDVAFSEDVRFRPNTIAFQSTDFGWTDFSDIRFGSDFAGVTPAELCDCCENYNCDCCGDCEICPDCEECVYCGDCEYCEGCGNCPCDCLIGIIMDGDYVERLAFSIFGLDIIPGDMVTAIISVFTNGRFETMYSVEDFKIPEQNYNVISIDFSEHNIHREPEKTFRAFVWDGFGNMLPLLPNMFEYPVFSD